MANTKSKVWWVKIMLYIFWGALSVFALSLMAFFGADMLTQTQASTTSDVAQGVDFASYVCGPVMEYATTIIGVLAVLMVVMAGITYALSMGGSTAFGSTSNAKEMISAAISGVLFFILGSILLGNCGANDGWLQSFFG